MVHKVAARDKEVATTAARQAEIHKGKISLLRNKCQMPSPGTFAGAGEPNLRPAALLLSTDRLQIAVSGKRGREALRNRNSGHESSSITLARE